PVDRGRGERRTELDGPGCDPPVVRLAGAPREHPRSPLHPHGGRDGSVERDALRGPALLEGLRTRSSPPTLALVTGSGAAVAHSLWVAEVGGSNPPSPTAVTLFYRTGA